MVDKEREREGERNILGIERRIRQLSNSLSKSVLRWTVEVAVHGLCFCVLDKVMLACIYYVPEYIDSCQSLSCYFL